MLSMSAMKSHAYDFRLPRLYVPDDIHANAVLSLSIEQVHYLKTVMRRPDGTNLRLFNGREGEWLATLRFTGKKDATVTITEQIRPPANRSLGLHLMFALIKKDRMDFMVEKAVELGVTDLHPILTQSTVIRDLNSPRMERQVLEAAEQCERLDLPTLHPLLSLKDALEIWPKDYPLMAALERENASFIGTQPAALNAGLLIGPEGGFSDEERKLLLDHKTVTPVTLGEQILRSETAALFGLSIMSSNFTRHNPQT